jgi:hypothetical protein
MPVPDDRSRLEGRSIRLDLDQDNHRRKDRHRRRSMHRNAKRTVVGIAVKGMHMRHLHYGKQRQQKQAQKSRHRQSAWLCAPALAEICLEPRQKTPLHQEYTELDAPEQVAVT